MEQQQQHQQHSINGSASCARQSSSRWTPTTDQIRILKELYYNNGVRSPNGDQIQKIAVRLRQYGKIEGKNVFYWFQNHKARERQKKRLFPDDSQFHHQQNINNMPTFIHPQIPQDYSSSNIIITKKYPNNTLPFGISSSSSASTSQALGVASFGYGSSVTMDKSFKDCPMIAAGGNQNLGWAGPAVGMDSSYYGRQKKFLLSVNGGGYYDDQEDDEEEEEEEQEGGPAGELETLPLFPVHAENVNINGFYGHHHQSMPENDRYYSGWCCSGDGLGGSTRTSLELSLNSYYGGQSS